MRRCEVDGMKPIDLFRAGFWGSGDAASIIAGLFAQGQQGFWFPFTDFASLSQDSAGTLPYTALEQPVGRVLDSSGRGNHASQVTSTARGAVGARGNALLNTDNPAAWGYAGTRFSVGSKDVDDGWPLTHLLAASIAVNTDYPIGAYGVASATIVRSIELQAGTASYVTFGAASSYDAVTIDLVSKVIVYNLGARPVTITTLADNWIRVEFWVSRVGSFSASSLSNYMFWGVSQGVATVGSTIKVRKPSYSRQALGHTAPVPFQRVGATATDYDSVGFPKYLTFDGVDDRLQATLPAITGTWIVGYKEGTLVYKVNIPAGALPIGTNTNASFWAPSKNYVGMVLRAGDLTEVEVSAVERYLVANGAGAAGVDAFAGVIAFGANWVGCTSITSFPLINTSAGTNFQSAWHNCNYLTSFPANMFDSCPATNFTNAFLSCALSQASVDGILASLVTAGKSNGTLNMQGGTSSTPSAAGLASKATLVSRGWTVTHN